MAEGQGSTIPMIIFFVVIFALMYLLMIRPQRKKQKEREELSKDLRRGDKVITAAGIYGQIESIGEDTIVLKIESGATMKVSKASVLGKQGAEQRVEKKSGPFM